MILKITNDNDYTNQVIQKRKTLILNKQFVQNEIELKMIFGSNFNKLFQCINISPQINVHFLDEKLLYSILSDNRFNLSDSGEKISILYSLRKSQEITEDILLNILSISPADELYYYIGVKTFFWEITIESEVQKCIIILCRKPEEEYSRNVPVYYLLEKRWQ